MLPRLTTFALLAVLAWASPAQADPASERRDAAEDALAAAQRLSDGHGIRTGRELTPALLEVARQRPALSRSDRAEADSLLGRPTDPSDTLQTAGPYTVAEQTPACTAHFCVHWVASTADQPPLADGDHNGLPDYIEKIMTAAEQSYDAEVTGLGWQPPKSDGGLGGDSGKTDIYVKELNPGNQKGLYGYANTDSPQSGRFRYGFLVLDNDYDVFEFPRYNDVPDDPIEVTVAHEFNHVLQFNYDISQDGWMYEASATWMEDKVFPAVDDYLIYMPRWDELSTQPITSAANTKQYGSAVFNHWLEAAYGGPAVIRDAWAGSASPANTVQGGGFAPQAYDAAIRAHGGPGFMPAFGEFATATATWDVPATGFHEGEKYGRVDPSGALQADGQVRPTDLDHTGFRLYDVPASSAGRLDLSVAVPSGTNGYIALVGDDGATVDRAARTLIGGGGATVSLADPAKYTRITAVLVNTDVQQDGYEADCDDWNWTRDGQGVNVRLSEHAAGDPASPAPATPATTISDCTPAVAPSPSPTPTPSPTATVSPTVTPTPTVVPPPPPPATSVSLSRNSTKLASVARKGALSLFARTNKAGRLSARGTVDGTTAKRLEVGRRTTTAGTGSRTATAPSRLKITVKLTRTLRAAIKRNPERALKIRVAVTFTPVDGTGAVTRRITITLKP